MKLRFIVAASAAILAASAFASNTATVTVTANVLTGASIVNMPSAINFGDVSPNEVQAGSIPAKTGADVDVYDNNNTGVEITSSCSGKVGDNGCYICKDGNCTANNERVLVQCSYTSCKAQNAATPTPFVVTPGATDANPFTSATTIPAANSAPSACDPASQGAHGSITCSLQSTAALPVAGAYTGNLDFTASDA